jgi:steroid 5-alpha reductase family enzyme
MNKSPMALVLILKRTLYVISQRAKVYELVDIINDYGVSESAQPVILYGESCRAKAFSILLVWKFDRRADRYRKTNG